MYENIDFDNIDLTQNPPQEEPDRQYYYIAKARQYVQEKSRKKNQKTRTQTERKQSKCRSKAKQNKSGEH